MLKTMRRYVALALCLFTLSWVSASPEETIAAPPDPTRESGLGSAVSVGTGLLGPAYAGCGGVIAPVVNADYEQKVVELVNAERAVASLPPLKRVTALDSAARYHATDMGQDNYFKHDSYDRSGGSLVRVCDWASRVQSYYPNWLMLAENIANFYATPESVIQAWMDSESHKGYILSSAVWEMGVGYFEGSGDWDRYWVQDFGRRYGVYPLVINREAATTDSLSVSLYIYGQGDWSEMRLRNDDGSWTGWMPFQSTLSWTLDNFGGERAVWVELRNGSQSTVSSDTIRLTTPVLGNLPEALHFIYSIPEQRLLVATQQVIPKNTGNDVTLTWEVAGTGSWFTISPLSGSTPAAFGITPTNFDTDTEGVYSGAATVNVTTPGGVVGSPHEIDLTLSVINAPFHYTYLPLLVKD
jgi:uncharacterized protein YkwD